MRCIWQMDGDKVKGFKCDFSPIDMLMIVSGLNYIVADIERHPKDRERAQGIYNQIMLCRYYDEADRKTENSSEKPNKSDIPTGSADTQTYITEDRDTRILDAWQVKQMQDGKE